MRFRLFCADRRIENRRGEIFIHGYGPWDMNWKLKRNCAALLTQERGYFKKVWGTYNTVCLVYPNHYRIGMANLGFQTVYKIFNEQPSFLCERLFLPAPENGAEFVSGAAGIVSIENQKPVTEFDILAFSISFENDYPNILKIMGQAKIPFLAAERSKDYPLILGGGIAPTLNPEPLADFFDLFILGESELALPKFALSFDEACRNKKNRRQFLSDIQKKIPGVYVPSLYKVNYGKDSRVQSIEPVKHTFPQKIKLNNPKDINAFHAQETVSASKAEMEQMFLIEANRGCAHYCRFCAASYVYHPVRFRKAEEIIKSVNQGLERKQKIGLVGTAVCEHPSLIGIMEYIQGKNAQIGIGSLRIDRVTEKIVDMLKAGGVETVALAPEAGSQKMRDLLGKGISEQDIIRAISILIEKGILNLRLYFMVGLPQEGEEDIDAIIELVKKVQHTALKRTGGKRKFRRITLSINQFIPKPHTPLQWCVLADVQETNRKIKKIVNFFKKDRQIKAISDVPKWNYIQAFLSLGDRRVSEILLAVHRLNGNWKKALKEININPDFYVYRQKSTKEALPWNMIEIGISRQFLVKEFEKALAGK
ncbi:MAG: radical SAM protein [Smithellaceae bacterium]